MLIISVWENENNIWKKKEKNAEKEQMGNATIVKVWQKDDSVFVHLSLNFLQLI